MKTLLKVSLAVLLCAALLFIVSPPTFAAGQRAYIEVLSPYAAWTNEAVINTATAQLTNRGFQIVQNKSEAELVFTFNITDSQTYRTFNWWILLFPLWPIIPVTQGQGSAMISLSVKQENATVFSTAAGGHEKGGFLFGDFASGRKLQEKALEEAVMKLMNSYDVGK